MSFQDQHKRFLLNNISLHWVLFIPFVVQMVAVLGLVGYYLSYHDLDLESLAVIFIPESNFLSAVHSNTRLTILFCALAFLISLVIELLIVRWINRPILNLIAANEALAGGHWNNLPENIAIAEFKTLNTSFNWMSAQLRQSFTEVENSLRESESKFFAIFQASPDPAWISTLVDERCLYVNESLCRFMEASSIDIIGKDCLEIGLWSDRENHNCFRETLTSEGNIQNYETVVLTATRQNKTVLMSAKLLHLDGQDCMIGIIRDISDRKQIEIDLRESQANLKASYIEQNILFSSMTDVVLVRDKHGRCLKVAPTNTINLKGTRDEVVSKSIYEELPLEVANLILQTIEKSLLNKQIVSCDYILEIDGKEIWFASNISPLTEDTVIQISRDITERKLSELALAKAKEAAEKATMAKSEFLANMSHEIRTPMNGVLVMAQLLATTELTEDQEEFVQTILESGDVLLTIINDILDFSKIESGMLEIEHREFVIADVLNSVCHLLNGQAKDKQIELQYTIAPELPLQVIGDSARLRQVLINLVGNAIKFTPQGKVAVSVCGSSLPERDKYELKFAIADTGIGIQGDRIVKLFQAFVQADTSISRRYGGSGLGLAISKRLVELMGGTIWAESFGQVGGNVPPNWQSDQITQGSTFHFAINVSFRSNQNQEIL